jgi:hypothetical protein
MATPTRATIVLNKLPLDQYGTATGGASPFATGAAKENALTEDPAEVVRWTLRRGNVLSVAGSTWSGADTFALVGLNCSKDAMIRFSSLGHVDEWIVPTSSPASVNVTGTYADVDDGIATVDGNRVTPNVLNPGAYPGTATPYIRVRFPAPADTSATGQGNQHFALAVSLASSAGETGNGMIGCDLYQNGVFKQDLGWRRVNVAGPISLVFPWDAANLASLLPSATVEAHVKFFWTDTAAATDRPRLDSITLGQTTAATVTTGLGVVQSGILSVNGSFYADGTVAATVWGPSFGRYEEREEGGPAVEPRSPWYTRSKAASSSDVPALNQLYVLVLDDGVPHWDGSTGGPSGYQQVPKFAQVEPLEFGALVAGYGQELSCTIAEGTPFDLTEPSERKRTAGSNAYGVRRRAFRSWKLKFPELTDAEAWEVYERLIVQRGKLRPIFVILHPAATAGSLLRKHTAGYFYVTDGSAPGAQQLFDDGGLLSPLEIALEEAI